MYGRSVRGAMMVVVVACLLGSPASAVALSPPQNESPPVLGPDNPVVGAQVTVTAGTWSGEDSTSTVSYQWDRFVNFVLEAIPGASGPSYTVTTADEGGLVAQIMVTAGSGAVLGSAWSNTISIMIPSVPSNVSPPVLSGSAVRGATLHVSTGRWSQYPSSIAGPLTYSYQWLRCPRAEGGSCSAPVPISGATKASYSIQPADWGNGLEVKVTATDLIGSAYAYSNGLGVTPPTVIEDHPPFSRWIAGDPLLITVPARGECFGTACTEESVAVLLRHNGFSKTIEVKRRGKLTVQWVATRAGRQVTIGSERAVFRTPGRHRTRFILSRRGRALLRAARRLRFLIVGAFDYARIGIGCDYSGTVNAARQIVIDPSCHAF